MEITKTVAQLENRCLLLNNEIDAIFKDYEGINSNDEKLSREFNKLKNRAGEYKHGTFIALVVGPAKSGKSTLVNLIAGAYVSPTNFLECTVRPSIISRKDEDEESSLTCYTAASGINRMENIDAIIDCVRGLDSEENLKGIKVEKLPLTEKNIKERVELGLETSLSSDTLITSISTPGGDLLQKQVFIIDMPGFDGAYMNIDDPTYDIIAQRADLIIFVQSSNSAFSKVSKDFLKILGNRNKDVPVCMIHNVFDAAWWKDREEKDKIIEQQRKFAYDEIRKYGFNIDYSHCYAINLGAVQDFRKGGFKDAEFMEESDRKYRAIEQELFNRIINRKDAIRLTNCINRTNQQITNLISHIVAEIEKREAVIKQYRNVKSTIEKIDVKFTPDISVSFNVEDAKELFSQYKHQATIDYSNDKIKYSNEDARQRITSFIDRVNDGFNKSLAALLNLSILETALFNEFRNKVSEIREELSAIPLFDGQYAPLEKQRVSSGKAIDIHPYLDINTIVPIKGMRLIRNFVKPHSADDMRGYLSDIENRLISTKDHRGQAADLGYLLKDIIPAKVDEANSNLAEIKSNYQLWLRDYVDSAKNRILSAIIPEYEEYCLTTEQLSGVCERLKKLIGNEN